MTATEKTALLETARVLEAEARKLRKMAGPSPKSFKPGITVTKKKNGPLRPGQNLSQGDGRGMKG